MYIYTYQVQCHKILYVFEVSTDNHVMIYYLACKFEFTRLWSPPNSKPAHPTPRIYRPWSRCRQRSGSGRGSTNYDLGFLSRDRNVTWSYRQHSIGTVRSLWRKLRTNTLAFGIMVCNTFEWFYLHIANSKSIFRGSSHSFFHGTPIFKINSKDGKIVCIAPFL